MAYVTCEIQNSTVRIEKDLSSKGAGQTGAILFAIQNLPWEAIINFKLGSKGLIQSLTSKLPSLEDGNWINVEDGVLLKTITAALRGRGTKCTFMETNSHDHDKVQYALDLAKLGLDDGQPSILRTDIPPQYELEGMKLKAGSQRTFYKALKRRKAKPDRLKTTIMLDITRHAAWNLSGATPTDSQIWLSIRHQDITRQIHATRKTREFLWRCMHQAYKVGGYWRNIPTYGHYATCQHCQVDETIDKYTLMEHVLIECDAPGREKLWSLAKELWEKTGYGWPEMNYGSIFARGLVDIRDEKGRRDEGAIRLFRILVTETAHLVWKLRCTRVIDRGGDPSRYFSEVELHNKWLFCINSRLKIDTLLTDSRTYRSRALNVKLVQNTWQGVLKDNQNLPDIWVRQSGFLVGIPPLRPPGRNQ
ncbi:ribonuclease H-like protein [Mycena filopes]|nr:ribonuclease H-like protein [Mycena filopes]